MSSIEFNIYIDFIKIHYKNNYDYDKCNNEYINNILKNKIININDDNIYVNIGKNVNLIFELDDNRLIKYDNIELLYKNNDVKIQYYHNNDKNNIIINYKDVYKINLSTYDYKIIDLCDNIIENEKYRCNGIGTEGINYLLNFLKNSEYIKIQGELSNIDNIERLKKFYKKNGFEIYKKNIEYIFCEKQMKTYYLLKKYNYNIKRLNISNKNIIGILDLSNFKNLEELDCSNNKISEIINISNSLKYLNCSNNNIIKINR